MNMEEKRRIAHALALILDGKNPYYRDRMSDPEFIAGVRKAYESEMKELVRNG